MSDMSDEILQNKIQVFLCRQCLKRQVAEENKTCSECEQVALNLAEGRRGFYAGLIVLLSISLAVTIVGLIIAYEVSK
jgi:hypothetical protein